MTPRGPRDQSASTGSTAAGAVSGQNFGRWTTSEGDLEFTGANSGRLANYGSDQGRILGDISGGVLQGYWVEASSAQQCSYMRDGSFYWGRLSGRFSHSGFEWLWSYCDETPSFSWTGSRS